MVLLIDHVFVLGEPMGVVCGSLYCCGGNVLALF